MENRSYVSLNSIATPKHRLFSKTLFASEKSAVKAKESAAKPEKSALKLVKSDVQAAENEGKPLDVQHSRAWLFLTLSPSLFSCCI